MPTATNPRRAEHDELRIIMARFSTLMTVASDVNHTQLVRERMVFSRLFMVHLAREQEKIAELSRKSPSLSEKTKQRSTMIADLRADYSDHVRRWTPPLIKSAWSNYRTDVLTLQTRLRQFMLWEEENLPLYA